MPEPHHPNPAASTETGRAALADRVERLAGFEDSDPEFLVWDDGDRQPAIATTINGDPHIVVANGHTFTRTNLEGLYGLQVCEGPPEQWSLTDVVAARPWIQHAHDSATSQSGAQS